MLFENIQYNDDLPFEVSFLNIGEESKHCHKELELILVLRGVTHYQIYHTDYELNTGDLIIADAEDLHQIHDSSDDILMLSMHIDTRRFDSTYPNIRYMFFVCEECMEGPSSNRQLLHSKLALLKDQVARLALHYAEGDAPSLLMEEINKLVAILVEHFQGFFMEDYQYKTSHQDMSDESMQRLCRITRYIMLNYKEKISLDDFAKTEHLSSYYLSHLIKENLGFNFQNFVNAIRLEFAEKLLVFSNLTLMQISQECGFSSPNYFNKCFSAWHGKTPAQYRKDYIPCDRSYKNDFTQAEAFELLSHYLNNSGASANKIIPLTPDMDFTCEMSEVIPRPHIIMDSLEDLMMFQKYEDKIQKLHPATIAVDETVAKRNPDIDGHMLPYGIELSKENSYFYADASCTAKAFEDIFVNGHSYIRMSGECNTLFASRYTFSPAYAVYKYMAEYEDPRIKVCEHHLMIKGKNMSALVFFNTDLNADICIKLPKQLIPVCDILIRREISDFDDSASLLKRKAPDDAANRILAKRINQRLHGNITFIETNCDINYILRSMDTVIFEFINIVE